MWSASSPGHFTRRSHWISGPSDGPAERLGKNYCGSSWPCCDHCTYWAIPHTKQIRKFKFYVKLPAWFLGSSAVFSICPRMSVLGSLSQSPARQSVACNRNVNSGQHNTRPTALLWLAVPAWGRHLWLEVTSYPNLICSFTWIIIWFMLALGKNLASLRVIYREINRTPQAKVRVTVTQWRHKVYRLFCFAQFHISLCCLQRSARISLCEGSAWQLRSSNLTL
jgi:hypothetical protein